MKYNKSKPIDKKQIILDTYWKYCKEYSVEEIASVFVRNGQKSITKQYVSLLVIAEEKLSRAKRLLGVE